MNALESSSSAPGSDARLEPASGVCVAVLGGGTSSERDVSLASARGVHSALAALCSSRTGSPSLREVRAIEIELDGRWRVGERSLDAARALLELADVEVFFLCLHGGVGEDGTVQGLLSSAGRRHTGSGVRASALCMDKVALRGVAREHSVRVAPGVCVSAREWRASPLAELARLRAISREGWVVKPRCGGSSVNTAVVLEPSSLEPSLERVFASGDDALVEARVDGVELSCGVLETSEGEPRALTPIEIQPRGGKFFDYEQKYSADGARELCPPVSVDPSSVVRVRALAERIHRAAQCQGYSRADFIVPRVGAAPNAAWGEPVLLEVNTLPGLTERSLLPQEAAAEGIGYGELCLRILAAALREAR